MPLKKKKNIEIQPDAGKILAEHFFCPTKKILFASVCQRDIIEALRFLRGSLFRCILS